jgi:flavin-dependent dehydrogenase
MDGRQWDAIVVGGRCAGAATALRFARSGRSVLMIDRTKAASFTLSTHLLVPWALARLDALDTLEEVRASGAPPIRTFVVDFDGESIHIPMRGPTGYALCVRRTTLDPLLVKAAEQAGATVLDDALVQDLVRESGRVCGVTIRSGASTRCEFGRIVIGADGRRSTIARLVEAPEYNVLPSPSGVCFGYFSGVGPASAGAETLQFASGPDCEVLCAPCDGGLHVVLLIVGSEEFIRINQSGAAAYHARLLTIPAFAPRLAAAQLVSKVYRARPEELKGFFRVPFGPGWALVGDAGYHAHPAAANGIADALRSAELLHCLVEKAWAENRPAETFLSGYQSTHDTENAGPYAYSYSIGRTNPFSDPGLAAFIRALARVPDPNRTIPVGISLS